MIFLVLRRYYGVVSGTLAIALVIHHDCCYQRIYGKIWTWRKISVPAYTTAVSYSLSYSVHRINNHSRSTRILLLQKLLYIVNTQAGHLSDVRAFSLFYSWTGTSAEELDIVELWKRLTDNRFYLRWNLKLLATEEPDITELWKRHTDRRFSASREAQSFLLCIFLVSGGPER